VRNKPYHIPALLLLLAAFSLRAQLNTFSPYSRYGLGEPAPVTFAHNQGMGGAYIALKPDSTMPVFINPGNPASYALIRLTSLEVGASGLYSQFTAGNTRLTKWSTSFSYGALGFPIRGNGGACFGIMPYSNVGYDLRSEVSENSIGNVSYLYSGTGGLNKAFLGYGIQPFNRRLAKFRRRNLFVADSLRRFSGKGYKVAEQANKLLSDLSIGLNVNYVFGGFSNTARVVYPSTVLYNNTYRERSLTMGDFTGNFGLQTAITIDSARARGKSYWVHNAMVTAAMDSLKASGLYSGEALRQKLDSMAARYRPRKRAMGEKVKFSFGYFMNLNNAMQANYNTTVYNYIINASGNEIIRDTVLFNVNQSGTIQLPLEQGIGIGFKKGERISAAADVALTSWQNYNYLGTVSELKNNYRVAAGINYVPEKYAAGQGAFFRRVNYRFGVSYQTGYIQVNNTLISNYAITAGLGLPVGVGRLSSMVNLSVQLGQVGSGNNTAVKENYLRFNFGFTFSDRWFQKFRYD
jgi:hypothetical protein